MILNPKKEGRTEWWKERQQKRKKKLPKLSEIFLIQAQHTEREEEKNKRSQEIFFSLKINTCA